MIKVVKKVPIMLAFATLVWFCGDAITLCRWGCQDVNYCGCAYAGGSCNYDCTLRNRTGCHLRSDITDDEGCCGFMREQHIRRRAYDCDPANGPAPDCACWCYYTSPSWCP